MAKAIQLPGLTTETTEHWPVPTEKEMYPQMMPVAWSTEGLQQVQ